MNFKRYRSRLRSHFPGMVPQGRQRKKPGDRPQPHHVLTCEFRYCRDLGENGDFCVCQHPISQTVRCYRKELGPILASDGDMKNL